MKIIARLLEKGDVFRRCGRNYKVLGVLNGVLFYRVTSGERSLGSMLEMSVNSKQKMELVKDCLVGDVSNLHLFITNQTFETPKQKKKTKPIKSITQYKQVNKKIRQADKLRLTTSSHF